MLGSLASLGSLVRMSAILHERGKSIPAGTPPVQVHPHQELASGAFVKPATSSIQAAGEP